MIYLILNVRSDNWTRQLLEKAYNEIPRLSVATSALNAGIEFAWGEVLQISFPEVRLENGITGMPFVRSGLEQVNWVNNFVKNRQLLKHKEKFKDFWIFTQSQTIFTQFRVAIKELRLSPSDVKIIFFNKNEEVECPILDEDGRLDYQPIGMFDTHRYQLRALL